MFFAAFRAISLLLGWSMISQRTTLETFGVFWHGIRLDLSAACYLFVIPLLCIPFLGGAIHHVAVKTIERYEQVLVAVCTLLFTTSVVIFKYWGTLLNVRALEFAMYPKEMLASVSNVQILVIVSALLSMWMLMERIRKRIFSNILATTTTRTFKNVIGFMVLLPITITGIRGGWTLIPVNEASAAYSSDNRLNSIALNPLWYLGNNMYRAGINERNPFATMDSEQAKQFSEALVQDNGDPIRVSANKTQNVNVVLILLESWTSDIIEPLGGETGVTPFFSSLSEEGLLFTQTYSSGFRTDQGLTSVLSGFPAIPDKSIIKFVDKTNKLPSLGRSFAANGYENRFYYGGELGFANMNNYLLQSGFEKRIDIDDFEKDQLNSKWGAHDQFVFDRMLNDLNKSREPFFSVMLTLSTHEPFEAPKPTPFGAVGESNKFKGSAWYTDQCLKDFFNQASKQPWYEKTLFVLVADHGHRLPLNRDYLDPGCRRIPV
ncbi:MAG: LTA synthase family protein, partial [Bacteroidota bacterium]